MQTVSRPSLRSPLCHTLLLGVLLSFTTAATCQSAPDHTRNATWAELVDKDLNLYRVAPGVYRSAQFSKAQVVKIEALGIHTSIDLREIGSDAEQLNGTSIRQVRVRTNTWSISDHTVITALTEILRGKADGPVLVHCHHGSDRTGLVTAMYRILYQGWTKDAALDELVHGGYGFHSVWKNIPSYIRNVDTEKIRTAIDKELAQPASQTPATEVARNTPVR